ncbi:MAG TPA: FlgD immunoglobulin-like domain containing protein [Candidatus Eisenbacteria bacterium]|nr:FlgD immunoglobulin-like domain containing protein [Candidatus Eisenbacteria bacterium]
MIASTGMRRLQRREPALLEVIRPVHAWMSLVGLVLSAPGAWAAPESFGARQSPLALSPEYGEIAFSDPGAGTGTMVVSTREGVEVRLATSPGGDPVGIYRAPGAVEGLAVRGTRAYLFQGVRGITALDLSDPASPVVSASATTPSAVRMGAVLEDGSCVAASDSFVHVFRLGSGGELALAQSVSYGDGRLIRRVRAQGDSILVVASRPGVLARLYVTIYRFPTGATSLTRLHEWISNNKGANDAVWSPPIAFIANGSAGIYTLNTATGVFGATTPFANGLLVRALGLTPSDLFGVGEARSLQRFPRFGALGDSLPIAQTVETLDLEPVAVAADGPYAYVSTRDVIASVDPDEAGRSQIEFPVSSGVPRAPIAPIRSVGRSRRIVIDQGLAYVADYTGGLRIHRAGGADTSLVGVLPPAVNGRTVDLALDAAQSRLYLASGTAGLEVVDVADPAAPQRLGSLVLPGSASAVAILDANNVAVARTGNFGAGVTFVDVSTPTSPVARGSVNSPLVLDPRALAARDTILFVADHQLGLLSIGFGNPDAPATVGIPSGAGARDLDLQGNILLVASRSRGLQVVDVFNPAAPLLRSEVPLPPVLGVTRNGSTAIACLGDEGVAIVDLTSPSSASLRSIVAAAGFPRDAAWVGDSLLIAGGTSVDRFLLAPAIPAPGGLSVTLDPVSALPRAYLAWSVGEVVGQVGWNLYREASPAISGSQPPAGTRINGLLIDPAARSALDSGVVPGAENRYRLEAVFEDGRLLTVAEGSVIVSAEARLGRPYPNPFRSADGGVELPYQTTHAAATVTLTVVDVRGRAIREITASGPASGGFGSIGWDGRDRDGRRVPGGVYYLYMRGGGIDDARAVVHVP